MFGGWGLAVCVMALPEESFIELRRMNGAL